MLSMPILIYWYILALVPASLGVSNCIFQGTLGDDPNYFFGTARSYATEIPKHGIQQRALIFIRGQTLTSQVGSARDSPQLQLSKGNGGQEAGTLVFRVDSPESTRPHAPPEPLGVYITALHQPQQENRGSQQHTSQTALSFSPSQMQLD